MQQVIRLVIIHRKRFLREGLSFLLSQRQHLMVLGSFAQASEAFEGSVKLRPDVVLLDFAPPARDGLREARHLRRISPDVKILMIGLTESESDVLACIEAGAAGYLLEEASLEELFHTIQAVAAGEAICSPKVASLLFSRIADEARHRERIQSLDLLHLTGRQREIIALIEQGLSNKEIAFRLHISLQTVKNHVHNILRKLQLKNRREAARYAREQGLLSVFG